MVRSRRMAGYDNLALAERNCPRATNPLLQHIVDVYASEINEVVSLVDAAARPGKVDLV